MEEHSKKLNRSLRAAFGSAYQEQLPKAEREDRHTELQTKAKSLLSSWFEENIKPTIKDLNDQLMPLYDQQEKGVMERLCSVFKRNEFTKPYNITHEGFKEKYNAAYPDKYEASLTFHIYCTDRPGNTRLWAGGFTAVSAKVALDEHGEVKLSQDSGIDTFGTNMYGDIGRMNKTSWKPHDETKEDLYENLAKKNSEKLLKIAQNEADTNETRIQPAIYNSLEPGHK
jgi:hypothetical protein